MLFSDERITLEADEIAQTETYDEESLHMRQLLKTRLIDMDLSVRALNCLKAAEVDTLGDLVSFNNSDLMKFRNFGKKSLTELEELVLVKGLNLSPSLITLLVYLLVSFIFLFLFMRNKSLSNEIVAVILICSLILLNPYLKPYHFIFFTPLLLLIKDSYLTNTKSMLLSIAYPSFFWIVASNLSVGTLTGYFQTVFFGLFVFTLVQ